MGDKQRRLLGQLTGYLTPSGGDNAGADSVLFWDVMAENHYTTAITSKITLFDRLTVDSSRGMPVGAANVPRSWGSLACAYFGQPSA